MTVEPQSYLIGVSGEDSDNLFDEWGWAIIEDFRLQAIVDAWNEAAPIPLARHLTRQDVLKRNWPELAAAVKAAAIRTAPTEENNDD